jgi:hypothetical protein
MLALTQPAEARIVYTPANVKIVENGGLVSFDLNHDGIPDFGLSNKYVISTTYRVFGLLKVVQARQANEIWDANSKGVGCAGALPKGIRLGSKGRFHRDPTAGLTMAYGGLDTYFCPWVKAQQSYLGLKFRINGKVHFGWARIKIGNGGGIPLVATLTGYAYETIPNKPIVAGKTEGPDEVVEGPDAVLAAPIAKLVNLGVLAMGSAGLSIWRRESLNATQ